MLRGHPLVGLSLKSRARARRLAARRFAACATAAYSFMSARVESIGGVVEISQRRAEYLPSR